MDDPFGFPTGSENAPFDQDSQPDESALPDVQGFDPGPVVPLDPPPPPAPGDVPLDSDSDEASEADAANAGDGAPADEPGAPRRTKGSLGLDVKTVTDEYVAGGWEPKDSDGNALALTPHRIAQRLKERDSLEKAPSTGAITNVLKAWHELHFASLASEHPLTFGGYVGLGSVEELTSAQAQAKALKKAAKAAASPTVAQAPSADVDPEDAV